MPALAQATQATTCTIEVNAAQEACTNLMAGQNILAGEVCITVAGNNVKVTYQTTDGWELMETHTWVGTNINDIPKNKKGNPVPGQFPYNSGLIPGATEHSVSIPLTNGLAFSCPSADKDYVLAAHAALRKSKSDGTYQTETGWGAGNPIVTQGNWGTYFSFTLSCSCAEILGDGSTPTCGTAYAYLNPMSASSSTSASTCFTHSSLDYLNLANRWGWTTSNSAGQTFELWLGAGQCDFRKGTNVGSVTVSAQDVNGRVDVTYSTNVPYTLDEVHVYFGESQVPNGNNGSPTVAPGQYTNIDDAFDSPNNYMFDDISYGNYFIAHAKVCSVTPPPAVAF